MGDGRPTVSLFLSQCDHPMLPGGGLDDALRNISEKLLHHLDTMACYRGEWRQSGCGWHRNPNSTQPPRYATQLYHHPPHPITILRDACECQN